MSWHEFPDLAPHAAQALAARARTEGRLVTTLDGSLQERLESLVKSHLLQFDNRIDNAALLVVEVPTGEIIDRVGSADFHSSAICGQYDACRAPRAPGSALKPFIYALAMEQQRLYPTEAFLDRNLDFGVYNPNNFDGEFNGLVSAGEALRWSLNVPAVQILDRAGVDASVEFLRTLGFDTVGQNPEHYGLGLVLGNCEVRLEALVNAYLALARLGMRQDAVLVRGDAAPESRRVLDEGVALALWYMLEQPFPDEPWTNLVRLNDRSARLCWKTGTSSGYRDAWAVAFNGHYVVGAWIGNTDSRSAERLIGAHAASWPGVPFPAGTARARVARRGGAPPRGGNLRGHRAAEESLVPRHGHGHVPQGRLPAPPLRRAPARPGRYGRGQVARRHAPLGPGRRARCRNDAGRQERRGHGRGSAGTGAGHQDPRGERHLCIVRGKGTGPIRLEANTRRERLSVHNGATWARRTTSTRSFSTSCPASTACLHERRRPHQQGEPSSPPTDGRHSIPNSNSKIRLSLLPPIASSFGPDILAQVSQHFTTRPVCSGICARPHNRRGDLT